MRRVSRAVLLTFVVGGIAACTDAGDTPLQPRAPTAERGHDGERAALVGPSPMLEKGPPIGLRLVAADLVHPVTLVESPDGTGRRFIVDQIGVIRVLLANGTLLAQPFLDVRSKIAPLMPAYDERGLLGLAFHPEFRTNGRFFVFYVAPPRVSGFDDVSTVSEFRAAPGSNVVSLGTERIVLQVDHPQFNHQGGTVAFGPDRFLYISIGDGGGANDVGFGHVADWYTANEGGNGQDLTHNLLGAILRIDVNTVAGYGIPADNPFVGKPGRDETWAYGFRNPYRFAFDRGGTRQLYVGDAGQNLWEEADIVVKGGNYGWNVKEGTHCFSTADPLSVPASCPSVDAETGDVLRDPIIEIPNEANPIASPGITVIVGGFVYRGSAVSQLAGQYVFGALSEDEDEAEGLIFRGVPNASGLWSVQELPIATSADGELRRFVLGFGEDGSGELYVLTADNIGPNGRTGKVFKIVPGSATTR